jgi:alkylation response protein AidB-like acyl-CoA dehydrogenase
MDLGLSEQQEILRRTAREFLEAECPTSLVRELEHSEQGYSPELWKMMAHLGWLGQAFPPEYGGEGASLIDQVVLFEEMGRALLPGPLLPSSVLSGQALVRAGSEDQKAGLLTSMARGETIVTAPLPEPGFGPGDGGLRLTAAGAGYVLNGALLFVPYAHITNYVLCAAGPNGNGNAPEGPQAPGITLLLVDARSPGLTVNLLESVADYKQHEVLFQDVTVPGERVVSQAGQGQSPLASAREWATVVQCAEMVGRAQKILEMVVEYSKVRVQFGRPIGAFQAVQHRCADLKVAVDGAQMVTHRAAWRVTQGLPCSEDVAMAKAAAGALSRMAVTAGHTIFAGIAFTMDHDMQMYTQRSKVAEANLGDTDFHLDRLGDQMGL